MKFFFLIFFCNTDKICFKEVRGKFIRKTKIIEVCSYPEGVNILASYLSEPEAPKINLKQAEHLDQEPPNSFCQNELEQRNKLLDDREEELDNREIELGLEDDEIKCKLKELLEKEEAFEKQKQEWDEIHKKMNTFFEEHQKNVLDLNEKKHAMNMEIQKKEDALHKKEEALKNTEALNEELQKKQEELLKKEKDLEKKETAQDKRAETLKKQTDENKAEKKTLDSIWKKSITREKLLDEKEAKLKLQGEDLRKRDAALSLREDPTRKRQKTDPIWNSVVINASNYDLVVPQLDQEFSFLKYSIHGTFEVIHFIKKNKEYLKDECGFNTDDIKEDTATTSNKVLLRMLVYYHPDKQDSSLGEYWKKLAEHMTRKLNEARELPHILSKTFSKLQF